jgi:2-keto-4-pentenoate hydratase/2-oxohepta-3-ene-1,7-dioic acid hydratase in catechol pathway
VDWEVELVVVIGKVARTVQEQDAWQYAAGVTIGQDLSERIRQFEGASPQYSLGKSFSGFGPTGPCIVTIDELGDADDLAISCEVNQEVVQEDRTSSMIFSVPALIAHLSGILQLYPGDLIFTGTPAGVGFARTPRRKIEPGTKLTSRIEGIGEISQTFL